LRRLGIGFPAISILTLLSGLIATASRRNLTNNFIALREEPCFLSGWRARAPRTSETPAFTSDAPPSKALFAA
jgi:hypothetical protein